jgi:hypothetical protein
MRGKVDKTWSAYADRISILLADFDCWATLLDAG